MKVNQKMLPNYAQAYSILFDHFKNDFQGISNFEKLCPPGPILEIGAGTGRAIHAIPSSRPLVLLEQDENMLKILNQKKSDSKNIKIVNANSHQLPFEDEYFSGAFFAFGSISEMHPIYFSLSEAARVTQESGFIYLMVVNLDTYHSSCLGALRSSIMGVNHLTVVAEAVPATHLGPKEFQTHFVIREPGKSCTHIIQQLYPSISDWKMMCEQLGLKIISLNDSFDGTKFDSEKTQIISIIAKKESEFRNFKYTGDSQEIRNLYDRIAPKYDEFIQNSNYSVPQFIHKISYRYKKIHPSILDLACGNGLVGKELKINEIRPSSLFGIDISEKMVSECRNTRVYTSVACWDLSFGIPANKGLLFDIITSFGLMEFLNDPINILEEIFKTLLPGGELWCSFETTQNKSIECEDVSVGKNNIRKFKRNKDFILDQIKLIGFNIDYFEITTGYISPTTGIAIEYLLVQASKRRT